MLTGKYLDSLEKEELLLSQNFWDNAVMNGGKLKNNAMEGYFEVNLKDTKTNSLKQLNQYLAQAMNLEKLRREKLAKDYGPSIDTTVTFVPPADTSVVTQPPAVSPK